MGYNPTHSTRPLPCRLGMRKGDTVALSRSPFFMSRALQLSVQRRWGEHGERARRKPLVTSRPFPFVALFPIVAPKTQNCSSFKCKTLPLHPLIVLLFFCCSYGAVASTHSPYYHSVAMVPSLARTALALTQPYLSLLLPLQAVQSRAVVATSPASRDEYPYDGNGLRITRTLIPVWRNKLRRLRIS